MRSNPFVGISILFIAFISYGCGQDESQQVPKAVSAEKPEATQEARPTPRISFSIVEQEVSDTPLKAQVEQHLVASGVPTQAELEAEILRRYRSAKTRGGFRHHNAATNVYIYVYGTREQATAGQGLWIGMLAIGPSDKGNPEVVINDERLAALSAEPKDDHGLSEGERKELFRGIAAAEDRARREAMKQVPDTQIMKQIEAEQELAEKYKMELAKEYSLSDDQLQAIMVEGVTKGWPY